MGHDHWPRLPQLGSLISGEPPPRRAWRTSEGGEGVPEFKEFIQRLENEKGHPKEYSEYMRHASHTKP